MKKQPNSRMCFVCGFENPIGLKASFYENEAGQTICRFTPEEEHQGYPGVMHGGIISSLLDEVMGRATIAIAGWTATARIEVRFHHPVPLGRPMTLIGEVVRKWSRLIEARGELHLEDGTLAAEAQGTYLRLPEDKFEEINRHLEKEPSFWQVLPD